jgi:hypothetical protein
MREHFPDDMNEIYLGDGCYASYDGFRFKLRAPREHGDHEIFLEPLVLQAFEKFVSEVRQGERT